MSEATRTALERIRDERVYGKPVNIRARYEICTACGQAVDLRSLTEVAHHIEPGHEPMPEH